MGESSSVRALVAESSSARELRLKVVGKGDGG